MIYYRIAWHSRQTNQWIWKTTALTSLQVVLQLLKSYRAFPQDRIRVFKATSKEELNEMLQGAKDRMGCGSVTATQFLQDLKLYLPEQASSTSTYGTAESTVRQATTVATDSPWREDRVTTGLSGFDALSVLGRRRLEIESGPGGDHDAPYRFTLPVSMPQFLAWSRLRARVQEGKIPS